MRAYGSLDMMEARQKPTIDPLRSSGVAEEERSRRGRMGETPKNKFHRVVFIPTHKYKE